MVIARIYLLDSIGEVRKFFDFDIVPLGYSFDCCYGSEGIISPEISYQILA
jgi:hypothetical protein